MIDITGLDEAIQNVATAVFEEHIKQSVKDYEVKLRAALAPTIIAVHKYMSYKVLGNEIVITLHDERKV